MEGGHYVILILYADDLFQIGDDTKRLNILEKELTKQYEMTNMGFMNMYIGIEFIYWCKEIKLGSYCANLVC